MAKLSRRKCKQCKTLFEVKQPLQECCSWECALQLAKIRNEKKQIQKRKEKKKELKEKLKTKSDYLQDVQKVFNEYIRLRDKGRGCISCGTIKNVKYDAGHFYSVGAYPNLRFNEDNCHKQCSSYCNDNLSGNIHNYRPRLIEKIGQQRFDELERQKGIKKHYSIPELIELKEKYKQKIKSL